MPTFDSNFEDIAIRAPQGTHLSCKGWQQEAALRMLMNSFDERVKAEHSYDLDLRECSGQSGRGVPGFREISGLLQDLGNDQTLLVKAGKPAGIFQTGEDSPRVLIVGSDALAGSPAEETKCSAAELASFLMEGGLASSSWTYNPQEKLHCAFRTFAAMGEKHFEGDLSGKLIVNCGMGRNGGLYSLAATMNGAAFLGIDVDPEQIKKQLKTGRCDFMVNSLDEALRILKNAVRKKENVAVGLVANYKDVVHEFAARGVQPDILNAAVHTGRTVDANLKGAAITEDAKEFVNSVPYIYPIFLEGQRPFRWFALSGNPGDIYASENVLFELFPENRPLRRWIEATRKRIKFQGLPSGICWLNQAERVRFGLALNELVKNGKATAPIVISTDQLKPKPAGEDRLSTHPWNESLLVAAAGASWISVQNANPKVEDTIASFECMSRVLLIDGRDEINSRIESALS